MPRVLVVDDEAGVRESLRMLLKGDCEVVTADGVDAGLRVLAETPPELVILDLVMPGRSGLEFLAELEHRGEAPPVLVLTATRTVATAVEAMKRGAADYVTKPFEADALRIKIRHLLEHRALAREVDRLTDELDQRTRLGDLVGRSDAMREVFRTIERVARSTATVLIRGESGTGKELAARAIHDLGPRARAPFVAVNCAAIPGNLMESELFGHERGAFTDARERRIGKFEAAEGGTLFLDEIAELAPALQAKLLRSLQGGVIERVSGEPSSSRWTRGSSPPPTATWRSRSRRGASGTISTTASTWSRSSFRRCASAATTSACWRIASSPSPGSGPASVRGASPGRASRLSSTTTGPATCASSRTPSSAPSPFSDRDLIEVGDLPEKIAQASRTESLREALRSGRIAFEETVAAFEQDIIREALERCGWNQTRAAEQLGITRRLLKLKMDKLSLGRV
jgi:DNA-binding NtrC family response regulator